MQFFVTVFVVLAIAGCALGSINPYIPVLVVPKNPIIKCPPSCTGARDCFFVHPLSETHFYSCFHGKAAVHQCPSGKVFSDDRHQCVKRTKSSTGEGHDSLSNAKITKLTEKIVQFEHLIDSFQRKLERVQGVIIESDNKIGLLGKFLLKAIKQNKENFCEKKEDATSDKETQPSQEQTAQPEPELQLGASSEDQEVEENGIGLGNDGQEQQPANIPPAETPKVEALPKESAKDTATAKASNQLSLGQPKSDDVNVGDENQGVVIGTEDGETTSPKNQIQENTVEGKVGEENEATDFPLKMDSDEAKSAEVQQTGQ